MEESLDKKGFELDPNEPYNTVYFEEDVKEFIKEILDEIKVTEENIAKGISNPIICIRATLLRNNFNKLQRIIKEKAGSLAE